MYKQLAVYTRTSLYWHVRDLVCRRWIFFKQSFAFTHKPSSTSNICWMLLSRFRAGFANESDCTHKCKLLTEGAGNIRCCSNSTIIGTSSPRPHQGYSYNLNSQDINFCSAFVELLCHTASNQGACWKEIAQKLTYWVGTVCPVQNHVHNRVCPTCMWSWQYWVDYMLPIEFQMLNSEGFWANVQITVVQCVISVNEHKPKQTSVVCALPVVNPTVYYAVKQLLWHKKHKYINAVMKHEHDHGQQILHKPTLADPQAR